MTCELSSVTGTRIMEVEQASELLEFEVYLELGDWSSRRWVTIKDPTVQAVHLMTLIAKGETDITNPETPRGKLHWQDESGRSYMVAEWELDDSASGPVVDVTFAVTSGDKTTILTVDELDGLTINVTKAL